jgi:uncharacterized membrane protein YphA (DoxX/SURF4 family)
MLYWATTSLIALETFLGGVVDLTHGRTGVVSCPFVTQVVTSLGYPVYILAIIGIFKIPGAVTIVVPGFLRLKEWAYAGIVFELSGAVASHGACGTWGTRSRRCRYSVSRSHLGHSDLRARLSERALFAAD